MRLRYAILSVEPDTLDVYTAIDLQDLIARVSAHLDLPLLTADNERGLLSEIVTDTDLHACYATNSAGPENTRGRDVLLAIGSVSPNDPGYYLRQIAKRCPRGPIAVFTRPPAGPAGGLSDEQIAALTAAC